MKQKSYTIIPHEMIHVIITRIKITDNSIDHNRICPTIHSDGYSKYQTDYYQIIRVASRLRDK